MIAVKTFNKLVEKSPANNADGTNTNGLRPTTSHLPLAKALYV